MTLTRSAFRLLPTLASAWLLTACVTDGATTPSAPPTRTAETRPAVCTEWLGIHYSRADTQPTKDQVRANNAARDAYCTERTPKPDS